MYCVTSGTGTLFTGGVLKGHGPHPKLVSSLPTYSCPCPCIPPEVGNTARGKRAKAGTLRVGPVAVRTPGAECWAGSPGILGEGWLTGPRIKTGGATAHLVPVPMCVTVQTKLYSMFPFLSYPTSYTPFPTIVQLGEWGFFQCLSVGL